MWKYAILISLLLCASSVFAQKPVIDSMTVNEDSSWLVIHGSFGLSQGSITIDSVSLPIAFWSDSLVEATIPDTGAGSYGAVVVMGNGLVSDTEILSCLAGIYSDTNGTFDIEAEGYVGSDFHFIFRLDFKSFLNSNFSLQPNKVSNLNFWENSLTGVPGQYNYSRRNYDSTYPEIGDSGKNNYTCTLTPEDQVGRKWLFDVSNYKAVLVTEGEYLKPGYDTSFTFYQIESGPSDEIDLDSLYHIIPYHTGGIEGISGPGYQSATALTGSTLSPPTKSVCALQYLPNLIAPKIDSSNWHPLLIWNLMPLIDSFEIEISPDKSFNKSLHDYQTIDTTFTPSDLMPGVQYYWRVRGKNSDGSTQWSSVWSFGENASSVNLASDDNSSILQVIGSSIQYKAYETADIVIYNVLGQPVSRFRCEGNGSMHSIPFSELNLRAGNYFAILGTGGSPASCRFVLQP
jgi:hypothetical protein